jgi:hypothetical protein
MAIPPYTEWTDEQKARMARFAEKLLGPDDEFDAWPDDDAWLDDDALANGYDLDAIICRMRAAVDEALSKAKGAKDAL